MSDPMVVNPQVVDAINQTQRAVLSPEVTLTSGAGKAYQSVAQSAAMAVQDATDRLRNIGTIATTAMGVALSQYLASGDPRDLDALATAQDMMKRAIEDFEAAGAASAKLLKEFPSG